MANVYYDNFFLSNEIEDQLETRLDLQRFATIDNNLVGEPGMIRKINIYSGDNHAETVTMGNGNTQSLEVGFVQKEYPIETVQARFQYYDEEAMADPMIPLVGARYMATEMTNTLNQSVLSALVNDAGYIMTGITIDFDAFADAVAQMNLETQEGVELFALICPKDTATLRKALKSTLQYIEAYARQGYIGSVAGVNVYTCKAVDEGSLIIAARDATTIFNKTGVEVEQKTAANRSEVAGNIRQNTVFGRKYFITAVTNPTHAVRLDTTAATATAATGTAVAGTAYYEKDGNNYTRVYPAVGDDVTGFYTL